MNVIIHIVYYTEVTLGSEPQHVDGYCGWYDPITWSVVIYVLIIYLMMALDGKSGGNQSH